MNIDITFTDAIISEIKGGRTGVLESKEYSEDFLNALLNRSIETEIVAAQTDGKAGGEKVELLSSSNGHRSLVQLLSTWIDREETFEVPIAQLFSQVIEESFSSLDGQFHCVETRRSQRSVRIGATSLDKTHCRW